jgi:RNA 2',3'-cyclic 3'-phosphodiesterase
MAMRLFVAADISDSTRAALRAVRDSIAPTIASARMPPRVTWVKDESAHVTLRFVGHVPDDVGAAIAGALAEPFDLAPFRVRWETIGTFPGGRSPRVVWMGATEGAEKLATLATLVAERLDPIVGPGENRPFKPHLTIGRIKVPGRHVDWPRIVAEAQPEPTTTRVDHVTLYQSRLSPKGPTYTAVSKTPLR